LSTVIVRGVVGCGGAFNTEAQRIRRDHGEEIREKGEEKDGNRGQKGIGLDGQK
jgi:hypothetical protein